MCHYLQFRHECLFFTGSSCSCRRNTLATQWSSHLFHINKRFLLACLIGALLPPYPLLDKSFSRLGEEPQMINKGLTRCSSVADPVCLSLCRGVVDRNVAQEHSTGCSFNTSKLPMVPTESLHQILSSHEPENLHELKTLILDLAISPCCIALICSQAVIVTLSFSIFVIVAVQLNLNIGCFQKPGYLQA